MPLFRKHDKPAPRPQLTINGRPQAHPETQPGLPRRHRLFIECERRLADNPLAHPEAMGRPVGDGHGLEGLVANIAGLFERERSLIRWVALRGAFAELFIRIIDPDSSVRSIAELEAAMGLAWAVDAQGQSHPGLAEPWRSALSPDQRDAALGVASSALIRAEDYGRYSELSVQDVLSDARCSMSNAVALDCIAWSATALLRLDIAQQLFDQVPEPDALPEPGWYAEPLFQKAERYWDGTDWTSSCRVWRDGRTVEASVPLVAHSNPSN